MSSYKVSREFTFQNLFGFENCGVRLENAISSLSLFKGVYMKYTKIIPNIIPGGKYNKNSGRYSGRF